LSRRSCNISPLVDYAGYHATRVDPTDRFANAAALADQLVLAGRATGA
jgi:hypothetical protein